MTQKTKKCSICSTYKPLDAFTFKHRSRGTRDPRCKECRQSYFNGRYKTSPERRKAVRDHVRRYRERNRRFVFNYLKEHPCIECGCDEIVLLEFNHNDSSTKEAAVSRLASSSASIARIKKEISKCDVLCVVCHRRKTAAQLGWYKDLLEEGDT